MLTTTEKFFYEEGERCGVWCVCVCAYVRERELNMFKRIQLRRRGYVQLLN